jgi:hypothetical protein
MRDDELLSRLEQLDPTLVEAPPAPGSARHTSILEHAMSLATDPTTTTDVDPARRHRRWPRLAVAAAAAAAVAAAALLLPQPGSGDSASAAVRDAAATMADITNLRAALHFESGEEITDVDLAVAGNDLQAEQDMLTKDDGEHTRYRSVVVDDIDYETSWENGVEHTQAEPLGVNYDITPFGEASAAVVDAALEGADVEKVGTEDVRGVATTHYRVSLAEAGESALAKLPRAARNWFDLTFDEDHISGDVTFDIWVDSDDLIRRFDTAYSGTTMSIEYFDFDADITITPPPVTD